MSLKHAPSGSIPGYLGLVSAEAACSRMMVTLSLKMVLPWLRMCVWKREGGGGVKNSGVLEEQGGLFCFL